MGTAVETVKIRGLAVWSSWIFFSCGVLVSLKGLWDLFLGEPEANLYAPEAWAFVTKEEWLRYGGFELAYGLACLGLAFCARSVSRRLPETIVRPRMPE